MNLDTTEFEEYTDEHGQPHMRRRGNPAASDAVMQAASVPLIEATAQWLRKAPLETVEQAAFVTWAKAQEVDLPELALLYAIPNAAKRSKATRGRMLAEGLRAGVPDLCLPVAKRGYSALFIEMKRANAAPSAVTEAQRDWHERLTRFGNYVCICKGAEAAKKVTLWYLEVTNEA